MITQHVIKHPNPATVLRSIFNNLIKMDTARIRDKTVFTSGLTIKFKDKTNEKVQVITIVTNKGSVSFKIQIADWLIKHPTKDQVEILRHKWYGIVAEMPDSIYTKLKEITEA